MADEAQGERARDRSEERRLTCHPKPSAAIKSQSELIKSQSELIKSQSELIKSQSDVIKSQSEVIKSLSLPAIRSHERPPTAMSGHQWSSEFNKSQSELIKSQSDSPAPERPTMATWSPAPIEIVSRCIVGRPCGGYDS